MYGNDRDVVFPARAVGALDQLSRKLIERILLIDLQHFVVGDGAAQTVGAKEQHVALDQIDRVEFDLDLLGIYQV